MALVLLGLVAACVYAMHMPEVPGIVGVAIAASLIFASMPSANARGAIVPPKASAVAAFFIAALGLTIAWATALHRNDDRTWRVLNDLGWAQAAVGAWYAYSSVVALSFTKMTHVAFGDDERERWRSGDPRFGLELARRIVVRAQPSWAALVIEAAWPEPRPEIVAELLEKAADATREQATALRAELENKGGVGEKSEARWELARVACEVIDGARAQEDPNDVGGPAVARFIAVAATTVRDDDDARRIFAALILPAIARRA